MKFTLIFRVPGSPGQLPVPLAASMDDEKDVSGDLERFKGQAKKIMRQTSTTSPTPCTIESGAYAFQYPPNPAHPPVLRHAFSGRKNVASPGAPPRARAARARQP